MFVCVDVTKVAWLGLYCWLKDDWLNQGFIDVTPIVII